MQFCRTVLITKMDIFDFISELKLKVNVAEHFQIIITIAYQRP